MTILESVNRTPGLEHLVLDRDPAVPLVGQRGEALFYPCRVGQHSVYRYALSRIWDPYRPAALWIMLNPSTADAVETDPTVRRTITFSKGWGCGGVVVANAFALRSTDPRVLAGHPDPVGPDNDQVLIALMLQSVHPVVLAWGCDKTLRQTGRDQRIIDLIHTGGIEPQALGVTKDGFPRHPLYVPGITAPIPFPDAGAYAAAMNRASHHG